MAPKESMYRSILGFYKEYEQDRVVLEVRREGDLYFVEIPSHLRNRLEIVVGSRLKGWVERIQKKKGQGSSLKRRFDWEIVGYWHELHIPLDFVKRFRLKEGDRLTFKFENVVNYGVEERI